MSPGISVVTATYCEKDNLPLLVNAIADVLAPLTQNFEIIVVDDNSPDGTAAVMTALEKEKPYLKFINRTTERGLASAVWRGVETTKFENVVNMDADFSHPPEDIARLYQAMQDQKADIVWASRWVAEGKMERTGAKRVQYYLSYTFNYFLKLFLGIQPMDTTNGFFISKKKNFEMIKPELVFDGYGDFSFKFAFLLKPMGIRVFEIPFTYRQRLHGFSKTKFIRVSLKYLREAMKIRWVYITNKRSLYRGDSC